MYLNNKYINLLVKITQIYKINLLKFAHSFKRHFLNTFLSNVTLGFPKLLHVHGVPDLVKIQQYGVTG